MSAVAGLLMLPVLLLTTTAEVTAAAFSGTLSSQSNRFAAAPDLVPPTVDQTILALTDRGQPGYVSAGRPYRIYAWVDDTGNPASGVGAVSANVEHLTTGETAAVLTPGTFTVAGETYNFRSFQLYADASLPDGPVTYSISAVDQAGNAMVALGLSVQADSTPPDIGIPVMHADEDGPHHIYAYVTDAGSGVASVTASIDGEEPVPMQAGSWEVAGTTYNHRTVEPVTVVLGEQDFSVTAIDGAGNASDGSGTYFGGVPAPSYLSLQGACTTATIAKSGSTATYLNDRAKTVSLPVPTGLQAGDLLVLNFTAVNRNSGQIAVTVPAGWTLVSERTQYVTNISTYMLMQTYIKPVSLPEPSSYIWSFGEVSIAAGTVAYAGVSPAGPVAAVAMAHGIGTEATVPSITPGVEHARLLGFGGMNSKDKATWTGHTLQNTLWTVYQHGSGNHQSISGGGDEALTSAGPTGTRTWTATRAEPHITSALALAPLRTAAVDVSWTAPAESVEGYQVVRQGGGQGTQTWTVPASQTSVSDTGLKPDTEYTYYVRAVVGEHQSDPLEGAVTVSGCTPS
jgi:hypothetical protein